MSYEEVKEGPRKEEPGYTKIKYYRNGEIAAGSDIDSFWVDTCSIDSIDKTSSSESTEATNSMFRWYQQADICFAYPSDVLASGDTPETDSHSTSFESSQWFTCGWTLQKPIAPTKVHFFSAVWLSLGTEITRRIQILGPRVSSALSNSLDLIRRKCSKSSQPSEGLHQINCEDQHSLALVNADGVTACLWASKSTT